jgi:hypothetical protein
MLHLKCKLAALSYHSVQDLPSPAQPVPFLAGSGNSLQRLQFSDSLLQYGDIF